jgi:2-desacetyl-2-hydroxyethyl bacteriochlorophyllide A dehydrogenase
MRSVAVEFSAPRKVELVEVEVADPKPGEALVRVQCSGISAGTEMLAYRGSIEDGTAVDEVLGALAGTFTFPFRFGYSCVGLVEHSRGRLEPGTLVFAFHPHQGLIVVPETELIEIGSVDARTASLFPLVETALQVSLDAGLVAHTTVVVSGLGAIGILTGALLARSGARVVGIEPRPERREAAIGFGIHAVSPDEVERALGGHHAGVPLVIEASGNPSALGGLIELLGHEGELLVASWYGRAPVELPLGTHFHRRRISIRSSQVSTIPARLARVWTMERRRRAALNLLEELPLKVLSTHSFPIAEVARAFAAVDEADPGLIHAALTYEGV